MEATRKRLEALLQQLQHATAKADHTIAEVKAALRQLDDERISAAGRAPSPPARATHKRHATRASHKR